MADFKWGPKKLVVPIQKYPTELPHIDYTVLVLVLEHSTTTRATKWGEGRDLETRPVWADLDVEGEGSFYSSGPGLPLYHIL